nr:PREDICTED: C-type lectin domain family 4 member F [Anolis carolinensis]|eukprot:XP_016849249.1 PREDICTED: C-type lectin domain family 4 member F [Anolis carolinensis]
MDKLIWLLIIIQHIFQLSSSLICDHRKKAFRAVLLEWPEFPKGKHPDIYAVTYHVTDDFIQKNMESISTTQVKAQNVTILLEEEKTYGVMVQSMKNGKILHTKSFKTRVCSDGWTAFKQNCYKISNESRSWKMAQQNCRLSSSGAHLVDIRSKEEHAFLVSYLQSFSHIIMLWTDLNDIKVSQLYFSLYFMRVIVLL